MTRVDIFLYFSYISFVFLKTYKNPYLEEREQAILVASFLYLGFQSGNLFLEWLNQWLSCFNSRQSQIKETIGQIY